MAYTPFKMKGSPMQRNYDIGSPAKQKTTKSDTVKTYPPSYTKEDIKFLEEQREDVVRYEDLDKKGQEIWRKQGKPIPKGKNKLSPRREGYLKKKKSPNKWAQFIPMALSAISSMKKKKE